MQRMFAKLALLLICALLITACGGASSTTAPGTGTSRTAPPASMPTTAAAAPTSGAGGQAPTRAPSMSAPTQEPEATQEPQMEMVAPMAPPAGVIAPLPASPAQDQMEPPSHPPLPIPTTDDSAPHEDGQDSAFFKNYGTNPFVSTFSDPLSTFAMDVDTASYSVMRRFLESSQLPDPDSVRVEEYVNYFDYSYPQPEAGDFAIYTEAAPSPYGSPGYETVQIGIQGRTVSAEQRKPASLTFVIDASGSMADPGKLEVVRPALSLLVEEMRPDDTISIVVYGSHGRVVLDPTSGADKDRILRALNDLRAEGSTNAQGGLEVGFELAEMAFGEDRINMILLCSDGVANNGITDPEGLLALHQRSLDRGIQISTFGFGMGQFNDTLMEVLANKGNGAYAYIDTLEEAERVFIQNLTGTLQTIARDAKIQVEFNPEVVSRYRLIGYENRDVADQDFRNDAVDAGEVGAGHSVTALYEIKRFEGASGEIGTVRIRYQRPDSATVVEESQAIHSSLLRPDVASTTPRFKLATTVAQYAELLRHSYWTRGEVLEDVLRLANEAASGFAGDADVQQFVDLLHQASALAPPSR